MSGKPFRTELPLVMYNRPEALKTGFILNDYILGEPKTYPSEAELFNDWSLRAHNAFYVIKMFNGINAFPLTQWGIDIKPICANPQYDVRTQAY